MPIIDKNPEVNGYNAKTSKLTSSALYMRRYPYILANRTSNRIVKRVINGAINDAINGATNGATNDATKI